MQQSFNSFSCTHCNLPALLLPKAPFFTGLTLWICPGDGSTQQCSSCTTWDLCSFGTGFGGGEVDKARRRGGKSHKKEHCLENSTPPLSVLGQVMLTFGFFGLYFFTCPASSCREAISSTSYKRVLLTVCIKHWSSWKIQALHMNLSTQMCIWFSLTQLPISEREEMWPLAWLAHCIYEARSHHKEVHQAPTSPRPQQQPISAVSTAMGHAVNSTEWCRGGLKKKALEKHLIRNWGA